MIATIVGVVLANTGLLIFFLGGVRVKLDSHDERLTTLETTARGHGEQIGELKGKLEARA